jgi:large subunit ribosomal protein L17
MMHRKSGRKLGMKSQHRRAMMANMCSSLVLHERVETTLPRAKELRRVADRMITLGKKGTVHARRHAMSVLRNRRAVKMLFDDLAKRFADRKGGYTRILKLGFRRGDSAPMAVIEYLSAERKAESMPTGKEKKKTKERKGAKAEAAAAAEEKKPAKKKAKAEPKKKAEKKTEKKTTAKAKSAKKAKKSSE